MLRPCLEPGCSELIQRGPRCPAHTRRREQEINRAGRGLYSLKKWELTRRRKLGMSPFCERCHTALANTVHHKVDLAEGGDEWALSNLASLCARCHNQITRGNQLGGA